MDNAETQAALTQNEDKQTKDRTQKDHQHGPTIQSTWTHHTINMDPPYNQHGPTIHCLL